MKCIYIDNGYSVFLVVRVVSQYFIALCLAHFRVLYEMDVSHTNAHTHTHIYIYILNGNIIMETKQMYQITNK